MTFAEGVLRLVRGGSRADSHRGRVASLRAIELERAAAAQPLDLDALLEAYVPQAVVFSGSEPGFADLEAAAVLVESGLATRVVLHGFESWPGLLWRSYELAGAAGVVIVPTAVHPGGRVDIAVTRAPRADD